MCCRNCGRKVGHLKTCFLFGVSAKKCVKKNPTPKSKPVVKTEKTDEPMTAKDWRQRRVASGLCGFCGKPRVSLKWLCDACAKNHRDRQRAKYEKRTNDRLDRLKLPVVANGYEVRHEDGAFVLYARKETRSKKISSFATEQEAEREAARLLMAS